MKCIEAKAGLRWSGIWVGLVAWPVLLMGALAQGDGSSGGLAAGGDACTEAVANFGQSAAAAAQATQCCADVLGSVGAELRSSVALSDGIHVLRGAARGSLVCVDYRVRNVSGSASSAASNSALNSALNSSGGLSALSGTTRESIHVLGGPQSPLQSAKSVVLTLQALAGGGTYPLLYVLDGATNRVLAYNAQLTGGAAPDLVQVTSDGVPTVAITYDSVQGRLIRLRADGRVDAYGGLGGTSPAEPKVEEKGLVVSGQWVQALAPGPTYLSVAYSGLLNRFYLLGNDLTVTVLDGQRVGLEAPLAVLKLSGLSSTPSRVEIQVSSDPNHVNLWLLPDSGPRSKIDVGKAALYSGVP